MAGAGISDEVAAFGASPIMVTILLIVPTVALSGRASGEVRYEAIG